MREILFRGKRMSDGEWVEGFYVCFSQKYHYILTGKLNIDITNGCIDLVKVPVDPATVGQDTGLTDKNGKRVFEGDICRVEYLLLLRHYASYGYPCDYTRFGVVAYVQNKFVLAKDGHWCGFDEAEVTVLGNIHDNPELME